MSKISIGKEVESSNTANIDLPTLVTTRLLIQANSGGGKSWVIRRLLEQSYGKVQHIIIDLEGEFSTLREKFDYLLIGKDGDVSVPLKGAELLARRLLELNVSAVIDLSEFKKHERILFAKRFLDALVEAPKELWHPCIIVIDESHQFCPEKGKSESAGSVIDICTRGRKRGFCVWLATQRLSKLSKDAAAECNNKLIGRTGLDVDMKRASDELGFSSKVQTRELRNLQPGEFFAFGPAISTSILKVKVGSVQTTHPSVGGRTLVSTPPARGAIKKLLEKLADLPKQAEEESQDRDALKKKIRELKFELRKKPKPIAPSTDGASLTRAEERGFEKGQQAMVTHYNTFLSGLTAKLYNASGELSRYSINLSKLSKEMVGELKKIKQHKPQVKRYSPPTVPKEQQPPQRIAPQRITSVGAPATLPEGSATLRAGAMRMLKAIAMFHPTPLTKQQIATLSGFSVKGGTFNTYLSELKQIGWVIEETKGMVITPDGLENAGGVEPVPTDPEELIELWAKKFRRGAAKLLKEIAREYPNQITKEELGDRLGYIISGGTFNTYLSELRRNGLIKIHGDELVATKELFIGSDV